MCCATFVGTFNLAYAFSISLLQVKRYWLNSDGADVVTHIIDNFLLDLK